MAASAHPEPSSNQADGASVPLDDSPLRLHFRPLAPEDAEPWFAYAGDAEYMRFTSSTTQSVDEVRALIARCSTGEPAAPFGFAVCLPGSLDFIGYVGFHTVSPLNLTAEVSYDVAPALAGRGIAAAACRAAVRWGFAVRGLQRIQVTVLPENLASRRVIAKLGFRFEGRLRHFRRVRGEPRDYELYARIPGDPWD
ncbi:MAG: GCN5-like N-acetyltransferase [Pseudomonadota bacterium]